MKTMRKLFTVLLALAMTLALAVPAFAADTTGSITITNPQGIAPTPPTRSLT